MPGLCGIFATPRGGDLAAPLARMLAALRHHDWHRADEFNDATAGVALGRVALGYVNAAPQPARSNGVAAVLAGELYQPDMLRARLRKSNLDPSSESHAEILLVGFERWGDAFLRDLHGSFVAAIWDAARRRLTLVNDRFGTRPLYYTRLPGKFLFASQIAALLADPAVSRQPSRRGLAQFFTFGQYLGDATSFEAVKVLPAASVWTYDAEADRLTTRQYAAIDAEDAPPSDRRELLERIDAGFRAAVARRVETAPGLGLSLSGGLDARTILAAIDPRATPLQTVCLGAAGSLDHRAAGELARLAGCSHHEHILDETFLNGFGEHLRRMVELTDGQYLSQCVVMPTLPLYRQLGVQVLLRGHAGELMHMRKAYAYSLDAEALTIRDAATLENWLFRHLRAYMLDAVEGPLLAGLSQAKTAALARDSLQKSLAASARVEPPLQRVWHLFVHERLRRETALSLAKLGSVVEPRAPYWDNDLVPLLLAAPPMLKLDETIEAHILRRCRPEFLRVVNSNTGAPVGASRVWRQWTSFRTRALAKLGAPGHQPYERLGLWLRRELAPLAREILLDPACLDRGLFAPDTVRLVVKQHLENRRNHTFLLMALLICELGQRRWAE